MSLKSALLQFLAAVVGLYVIYAYLLRFERQIIARLGLRGDERWGIIWPLVDVGRTLGKRGVTLTTVPSRFCLGAPLLTLGASMAALATIPWGIWGQETLGRVGDLPFGLWLPFVLDWIALLGPLYSARCSPRPYLRRESEEMVSQALWYGIPSLLSLAGVLVLSTSFNLREIVASQYRGMPYIAYQPLGLLIFVLSALLGGRRLPYRLPQGQDPALGDFHIQHAGRVEAIYHLAQYLHLLLIGALISTIYLAGCRGPWRAGPHWLAAKVILVTAGLLWARHRLLPRLRERWGTSTWRLCTLLALFNTLLTVLLVVWEGA
ncbi:MAG: NADH-quinone oxidoreductase subunit H [Chloroflexota bacterium]|nr:NADH-quinone oxidoreductase subunit H [Chloroflexota bacterium]